MPARSLHGDVQPRNLVIGSHGVGLIDWEGFWRHGLPGLDLVFLALMSARRVPDQRVIAALAHGEESPGRPLRAALAEVGVAGTVLRASLLAMLAVWTLGEARRMARGGRKSFRRHRRRPFRAMLSAVGPVLASEP
jgi:aminoglycoside phosphotransferase (APT) family kinase protein